MGTPVQKQAIILDLGSCNIRVGFSDARKQEPDHVIETNIWRGKLEDSPKKHFPVKNGTSPNLAGHCTRCKCINSDGLRYLTHNHLGIRDIGDHPILLVESALTDRKCRLAKLEVFFEEVCAENFALVNEGLMSLYSCGRHTGVVVHSGYTEAYCCAIHEGILPSYAIVPMHHYSGYELAKMTRDILERGRGTTNGHPRLNMDLAEAVSFLETHGKVEQSGNGPAHLDVGSQIGDQLFGTSSKNQGLHDAVERVIYQADEEEDYNHFYYENIVLSGGSTKLPGLPERLGAELEKTKVDRNAEVSVIATSYREHGPWVGGSIAASLPTFNHHWITRQDYQEYGGNILRLKCLS